jgi:hypothetical protein
MTPCLSISELFNKRDALFELLWWLLSAYRAQISQCLPIPPGEPPEEGRAVST